ncbi:MAG: DUF4097 family beta strand repeat protein [Candidatus Krumholzibacteriota bacterium]|nr:DUF4097 family beta strand repeat protein [Candidatus Krumholzibacteriota bacterium]
MNSKLGGAFILIFLAVFASSLSAYQLNDTWEKTFTVREGSKFILENINGSIAVEGWNRDEIEVYAQIKIKAPSKSKAQKILKRIEFEVDSDSGSLYIKARIPKIRQDGLFSFFGSNRTTVNITYSVKVPYRTDLNLESVNGRIMVDEVEGEFRLKSVNGRVKAFSMRGEGDIQTVNGGVDCVMEGFPRGGKLRIRTVNGGISLEIPEDAGARLESRTSNGRIRMDVELSKVKKLKRKRIEGTIGDGDGYIYLQTTNGKISIGSR